MTEIPSKEITFTYRNWRGETSVRTVIPLEIWFGRSEWHPTDQWFLKATDVGKAEVRDFALTDMRFD